MTKEDILRTLKSILAEINESENAVCYVTSEDREVIKSAIKALEQEPKTDYKAFAEWVAEEIIDEENWKYNADPFPEIACRKLHKLGIMNTDGKNWIYENEALEQEPCEDCISRDMALEKMSDYVSSGNANSAEDFEEYSKIICQLPSVQPKAKTGHWIDDEFGSKCSCCGIHTHLDKFGRPMKFKYCSMCGARMESEGEE